MKEYEYYLEKLNSPQELALTVSYLRALEYYSEDPRPRSFEFWKKIFYGVDEEVTKFKTFTEQVDYVKSDVEQYL